MQWEKTKNGGGGREGEGEQELIGDKISKKLKMKSDIKERIGLDFGHLV